MNSRHILYSRAEADAAQDAAPSAHAAELQRIAGQLDDLCQALESCRILRRDCERAASDLCARALPFGGWSGQALAKANFCRSYFDQDDDTACYALGPQTGGERRRPEPLPADPSIADILAAADERDRWERERPAREERRLAGLLRNMADQLRRDAAAMEAGAGAPVGPQPQSRRLSRVMMMKEAQKLFGMKEGVLSEAVKSGRVYRHQVHRTGYQFDLAEIEQFGGARNARAAAPADALLQPSPTIVRPG